MPGSKPELVSILAEDEPPPYTVECEQGRSRFLLICDHAGRRIPRKLGTLGLSEADLQRHIAWDIGAAALTRELAARLDATAILQTYSRLVIDCNRPPGSASSIVRLSERTVVPGNASVSAADAQLREREIFRPYHERIQAEIAARGIERRETLLVAIHSFTPVFHGAERPWHMGLLYLRDARLARPLLAELRRDAQLVVGDNEPYAAGDQTDYAIPVHGEGLGLQHVGIEVRQDLISHPDGVHEWSKRLAAALQAAAAR
jgi:predicted N-formylglutamate amidohydrolase